MKFASVEDEYVNNPKVTKQDVLSLLEWAEKQPHLPKITELEAFYFLNCYSGSIEQAKGLVEAYFTTRTHLPEFFSQRNPRNLLNHMNVTLFHNFTISPRAKAVYTSFVDTDPSNYSFEHQIKLLGMVFDVWYFQEGSCDSYEGIVDMKGFHMGHLTKFSIATLRKGIYILQEALIVQIKFIHVINVKPIVDKIMMMIKPFLKKELLDKIIFHTDGLESFYKYIPKTVLLQNLGGDGMTVEEAQEKMKRILLENEDYFQEEEKKRVDESKRVEKSKMPSDLFGIEGSFKKLDID